MIPTNVMPFPEIEYSVRCGVCPKCAKTDGFVNLGKNTGLYAVITNQNGSLV